MKICLVSGIPVLPTVEGNRSRILALSRAIRAQGHDLWVVLLPAGMSLESDRAMHLAEFGAERFLELPPPSRAWRFLRALPFRIHRKLRKTLGLPLQPYNGLDDFYQPSWTSRLTALHQRIGFDAVIVEYVFHSQAFMAFPQGIRRILDTHDSFADRHKSYLARGLSEYFFSVRPQEENRGFRRADVILAIQALEATNFRMQLGNHPGNPEVAVVSHFNDLSAETVTDHSPCRALFLASDNSSNTLAAQTFIAEVLPRVRDQLPGFQLVLAGRICRAVGDHPGVVKLGHVARVIDAFRQAPVLINPMLVGTGINIKLLDAMTAGIPVVSTDFGIRGLPEDFRDFVVVVPDGDHQAFADQIVLLMQDDARRRALGTKGRAGAARWNRMQEMVLRDVLDDSDQPGTIGGAG